MTERDFWQETALAWLNAKPHSWDGRHEVAGATGICPLVDRVGDMSIRVLAHEKLSAHLPTRRLDHSGHRWVTNRHGARSRALFCLRMATLCPGDGSKITTAREAWFLLAQCWLQAKLGTGERYRAPGPWSYNPCGVCHSVGLLVSNLRLSHGVHTDMLDKLNTHKPEVPEMTDYCWAMNRHGARSRTLFCLRMAGLSK